jgi:hypothetical protein
MARRQPVAFLSYVHSDDKYGRLTEFRQYLSDEVRMQIGEEFPIFQDRDIQWEQNWQERGISPKRKWCKRLISL